MGPNLFSSFCAILLINQPTNQPRDTGENLTSEKLLYTISNGTFSILMRAEGESNTVQSMVSPLWMSIKCADSRLYFASYINTHSLVIFPKRFFSFPLRFTLRAVVNGKAYPPGAGKNKKEARQNAAKNALKGLLEEPVNSVRLLYCFFVLLHVWIKVAEVSSNTH